MGQTNFFKIFSIIAFLAFASVSCWATAASLHLLLSSWPLALCWIVTIGFFVIASWGTKMIVDSLNQKVYMEKRGIHLLGGILIVLIFWLCCIMPTNTHTFFFRNIINDKINSDIVTTQSYLLQIANNNVTENDINKRKTEIENAIASKLIDLRAELNNPNNIGNGKQVKEILHQIADILQIVSIEPLSGNCSSVQERNRAYSVYEKKIYEQRDSYIKKLRDRMIKLSSEAITKAKTTIERLNLIKTNIDNGTLDVNDADNIKTICDKLNEGYIIIKDNQDFVNFSGDDKLSYTTPNPVTKVKRLTSVFDVWSDFLNGNYAGHGFVFWVLISVLVDIAAFIFFDLAF